ncbi:nucleotide-diphospho-sugar transferase [Decorospora gaudefroyi]|uniref:Nucleotide-diphospho-sugar transferase n=1 Tax=Decorospora gaudefroyi TaxID=184978 RepID=A0A6A5K657_9PLEO|nr:nucleotide-diphospho-sugar transferase [Decorospora gaudefroyi]
MKTSWNIWTFFSSPRWIRITLSAVVIGLICIFLALQTRAFDHAPPEEKPPTPTPPSYLEVERFNTTEREEKLAYVTFLSGTVNSRDDLEKDKYFVAVRILIWQLKHNLHTRTKHDVVVMVTPSVSRSRRDRLKRDGAIVYPVEFLHTENDDWIHAELRRWDDVITKLRVWEMIQYDRILMLDGDSMLLKRLDGVFDDPGAQLLATKPHPPNETLPETYLLASNSEVWDSTHKFPPADGTGLKKIGRMNAGFFILAPSLAAFEHYKSFLSTPGAFDPKYPEQNLMNHVHRWDGPMPWREIAYTWNIRCPNDVDIEKGLVSVHEKWWTQPYIYNNKATKEWLFTRRWEMKGWYDAWDALNPV